MEEDSVKLGQQMVQELRDSLAQKAIEIIEKKEYASLHHRSREMAICGVCTEISTQIILCILEHSKVKEYLEQRHIEYREMCTEIDMYTLKCCELFLKDARSE